MFACPRHVEATRRISRMQISQMEYISAIKVAKLQTIKHSRIPKLYVSCMRLVLCDINLSLSTARESLFSRFMLGRYMYIRLHFVKRQ